RTAEEARAAAGGVLDRHRRTDADTQAAPETDPRTLAIGRGCAIRGRAQRRVLVSRDDVYAAINDQVNNELSASHSYLAMSGVCEELNYPVAARWFRLQSEEERGHALRLFDFIHTRYFGVTLRKITVETTRATTRIEIFRAALSQEEQVSQQIDALYDLAMQHKDFA